MGPAARRFVRSRLAALVCVGGVLLSLPSAGLAADWTATPEPVTSSNGVTSVVTGLDGSSNLTAVWADGSGIESSVRSATSRSWSAPVTLSLQTASGTSPDLDVATDGGAVAAWTDASGNVWASSRTNGAWIGPAEISSTTGASSPQVAIVNGTPRAFWLDSNVIEQTSATSAGLWTTPIATPSGAAAGTGEISDLRVALATDGSGVAAWLRTDSGTTTLESATIATSGDWTVNGTPLSSAVDPTSTVAAAAGFGRAAVAWSEATGTHVAVLNGSALAVEPDAATASATTPSLAIDASGQIFASSLIGAGLSTRVRDTTGAWSLPTPIASNALASSASSDTAGDVVVAWPTTTGVQLRAYDASPPLLTLTAPASPLPPGDHTWSVSSSDVWSNAPAASADWSFSPGGTQQNAASVVDSELIPGPVTATVTVTDSSGNTAQAQATITVQPVAPVNTHAALVGGGSAPVDGGTLTVQTAGTWTGNPTPVVTPSWQRCSTAQNCTQLTPNPNGSYTLKAADVGFRIRIQESANNSGGTVLAYSAETPVVKPISTVAPTLTPSDSPIADGVLLTASSGSWNAAGNLAFGYVFLSCDVTCSPVQAGGSNTYTPGPGVVGTNVEVQVTATAGPVDGLTAQLKATSAQVGVVAPHATAAPGLTGGTQDTQTLTATSPASAWNGATGLDPLTYVFSRCDPDGSSCATQQSGSVSTYKLGPGDIGSRIKVAAVATATDSASHVSAQVTSASSSLSAVVTPHFTSSTGVAAPTPTLPATLVQDGVTLVADPGTWDDPTALTFSYQYYQCVTPPSNCAAVGTASASPSYLLQPSDVGLAMLVVVTATANDASTSVTSDATVPVQPLNDGNASIALPTVQQDTQVFSSSDGSWHGASGLTFAYRWKRCDVAQTCTVIPGATARDYTAVVADVGDTLRVTVSASKGGSAVTPSSGDSSPTAAIAPFPTIAPILAGVPADTKTLTAADGAWNGAAGLNETFQFSRCDSSGGNCNTPLQNTGSNVYTLGLADIGSRIQVVVFAKKNSSASIASAGSIVTSIITPLSTAAPAAPTGTTQDGQQLTALDGTWADQAGLSFRYQWYHCAPTCTSIVGSVAKTYTLQPADVGAKVYADTTAFIGAGAATTASPQTLAVAPLSTGPSSISTPTAQDGQLFSASTGDWNGAAGLTFAYQWRRCDTTGANCAAISNSLGTYIAGAADVGFTLEATVSASKGGSATTSSAFSQPSAVVAPRNTVRPAIAGDPTDGQTLTTPTSTNAAWNNTPAVLSFAYQWLRCDAAGANCAAIDGASTPTYKLTADDVTAATDTTHARHKLAVQVTATVNGVTTPVTSDVSPIIAPQTTAVTTLPRVTGGAFSNQPLIVQPGSWTGTGISYQDYQWVRCDPPLVTPACTNLGPASITATGYTVQDADVGHYVTVIESVVNRLGDTKSVRAAFGVPVLQNQFGIVLGGDPVVSGSYVDGRTLTTTSGTWNQTSGVVYSYSWLRCAPNANGSPPGGSQTCPSIPHANTPSYTLTPDDIGKYVVAHVKGEYAPASANAVFDSEIEGLPAVAAAPPLLTVRPTISGIARQDVVLTASSGTWSGTNTAAVPMSFGYQWSRCDTDGTTCQPIPGATGATYTASGTDVGLRLLVKVTATNSGGTKSTVSDATDVVATSAVPAPPGAGAAPAVGAGPGGPGISATSTKTDKTAPRLTLTFLGRGTLLSGTTLRLNATCPRTEKSCTAKFQLLATLKKPTGKAVAKPVVIARTSTTLKGGQKKLLKLKLSSAARSVLKRSLTLKVTLMANVVDAAGNVTPKQTKGITLRWKKA